MIFFTTNLGECCELDDVERAGLIRENVARLIAFRENPPPAPPQKDYTPKPLTSGLPPVKRVKRWNPRKEAKFAAHIEGKYGRQFDPVRMTSSGPPPQNSESLLDNGSK